MKCPVCKNHQHVKITLKAGDFTEKILECRVCGSIWAVNHGAAEIIRDTQEKSFLEGLTECVEGNDYNLVA